MHWLTLDWWCYLFSLRFGRHGWTRFWCRLRDHPGGVRYYNPGGLEPDMHCLNCGEDLG